MTTTRRFGQHVLAAANPQAKPRRGVSTARPSSGSAAAPPPAVDDNVVDKRAAVTKEIPVDTTALAAARRARVQALKDYLVKAVLDARPVKKVSNNGGDLTEDQIRPTLRTDARDVNAPTTAKAKGKRGRRIAKAAELTDEIRRRFDEDLVARVKKIQALEAERDKLSKAAMDSGASGANWAHSSARIGLDTAIQTERLALGQLYGGARPDLLAALAEVQRRAAGGEVYPPVPSDRAQLRSAFDGSARSYKPNPAETMTSGQLNNLKKRMAKSTSANQLQALGEQATLLALRSAAQAQFGNRPPLGIRGR